MKNSIKEIEELVRTGNFIGEPSYAKSNNREINANNVKLLIVGTITPQSGRGYFYTAPKNNMYKRIDLALNKGTNFEEDVKELNSLTEETLDVNSPKTRIKSIRSKDNEIIKKMIKKLNKEGIYFLDVFESVIRKNKNLAKDDFYYATLDCANFKKLNEVEHVLINSKEAYMKFRSIVNKNNDVNKYKNILCLPQLPRGFSKKNRPKCKSMDEIWANVIRHCLFGDVLYIGLEKLCTINDLNNDWPRFK